VDDDDRLFRDLLSQSFEATRAGDVAAVLALMTEDVLFLTPGRTARREPALALRNQITPR
jgi:ketosteroid isomerase-like protein